MKKAKAKEVLERELTAGRTVTGTSPFLKDVWHGVLKVEYWLPKPFEPGDTVRITVERIRKKKS